MTVNFERVNEETLKAFDEICGEVENAVVEKCLSADAPEETMGPEAETMLRSGMQFVTKMLRVSMQFAAGGILEDQIEWGQTRLPEYGANVAMVRKNIERYMEELRLRLPSESYEELRPYIELLFAGKWDG